MSKKPPCIISLRYGRLVVVDTAIRNRRTIYICRCDCGTTTQVRYADLKNGKSKSCGCWRNDHAKGNPIHGDASRRNRAPEYSAWRGIIERCCTPSHKAYRRYGGRGITICAKWHCGDAGIGGYECFLTDVGRRPTTKHQIDRINNDGNYEPGNWVLAEIGHSKH